MHALFACVLALANAAPPPRAPIAATVPVIAVPKEWLRRPIPKDLIHAPGLALIAAFVKPSATPDGLDARLFIWGEPPGSTPEEIAIQTLMSAPGLRIEVRHVEKHGADVAVTTFDTLSKRGGYEIHRLLPDGRVMSFDADFPPDRAKEIIADVDATAAKAF